MSIVIGSREFNNIDSAMLFFGYDYNELQLLAIQFGVSPELALSYAVSGDMCISEADIFRQDTGEACNIYGATRQFKRSPVSDDDLYSNIRLVYQLEGIASALNKLPRALRTTVYSYGVSQLSSQYIDYITSLSDKLTQYRVVIERSIQTASNNSSRTTLLNIKDKIDTAIFNNNHLVERLGDLRASALGYYRKYENRQEVNFCTHCLEYEENIRWFRAKLEKRRFNRLPIKSTIAKSKSLLNSLRVLTSQGV